MPNSTYDTYGVPGNPNGDLTPVLDRQGSGDIQFHPTSYPIPTQPLWGEAADELLSRENVCTRCETTSDRLVAPAGVRFERHHHSCSTPWRTVGWALGRGASFGSAE